MTKVFNSIIIGFEWAQDLTLAADTLDPGDGLRADFRYSPRDAEPIFSLHSEGGEGIIIDGQTVELVASGEKTALVGAPAGSVDWRMIYAELVKVPTVGEEGHLGFRLAIPAELPVTRAEA